VAVAKAWDDLYIGVKGLSRRVIAGSLRKIFKYRGVKAHVNVRN